MSYRFSILFFFLSLGLEGQENSGPPRPALDQRVETLEDKNKKLEERLKAVEGNKSAQPTGAGKEVSGPPGVDKRSGNAPQGELEDGDASVEEQESGLGLTTRYGGARAIFNLYCDLGFLYANPPEAQHANSSFGFGSIDLFGTGQLSERVQVLTETVLEGSDNEIGLDQERLWASWTLNDYFYAKCGLEHLPTSRWNRIYHHGKWLQMTIERPLLARFEDDGGILAKHYVGLEVGGHVDGSPGRLEYMAIVSNGRGKTPDNRQVIFDENNAKAFDAALAFVPSPLRGLRIGGAFRFDEIPADPANPARTLSIRELQGNVNLEWKSDSNQTGQFEVLAEAILLSHKDRTGGRTFNHTAAYFQTGYRITDLRLTPYVRFDLRAMRRSDPYYEPENSDLDMWEQLFGLRYDITDNAALKFEVGFGRAEDRDALGVVRQITVVTAGCQISWVF